MFAFIQCLLGIGLFCLVSELPAEPYQQPDTFTQLQPVADLDGMDADDADNPALASDSQHINRCQTADLSPLIPEKPLASSVAWPHVRGPPRLS